MLCTRVLGPEGGLRSRKRRERAAEGAGEGRARLGGTRGGGPAAFAQPALQSSGRPNPRPELGDSDRDTGSRTIPRGPVLGAAPACSLSPPQNPKDSKRQADAGCKQASSSDPRGHARRWERAASCRSNTGASGAQTCKAGGRREGEPGIWEVEGYSVWRLRDEGLQSRGLL